MAAKFPPHLLPPKGMLRKLTLGDGKQVTVNHHGHVVAATQSPQDAIAHSLLDPSLRAATPHQVTEAEGRPLNNAPQNNRGNRQSIIVGGAEPTGVLTTIDNIQWRIIGDLLETPRDQNEGSEAVIVTLGLDTSPTSDAELATKNLALTATLEFGAGGATFTAEVDWRLGTILTLPANYIKVNAKVLDTTGEGNATPIILSASFAYGSMASRGNTANARLTKWLQQGTLGGLNPGQTSDIVKVPNFATSFSILDSPFELTNARTPVPNAYRVDFFNNVNGTGPQGRFVKTGYTDRHSNGDVFPVPNGGNFVKVTNLGTLTPFNAGLVFNLSF